MKVEQFKRIFFDVISASVAWGVFFYYRKIIIEGVEFETSETFFYGIIGISVFWAVFYTLSGNYIDVRRASRLNELYKTVSQSLIGCLIIFFCLIIDDIEYYQDYKAYYQAICILILSHFSITFFSRYILTSLMVKKIQKGEVQFKTILIGNSRALKDSFNRLRSMSRSTGNNLVGYINCEDNITIDQISIPKLGHLNELEKILNENRIEEAILTVDKEKFTDIANIINILAYHDIITKVTPDLVDLLAGKVKMRSFFDVPLIEIKQIKMSFFESFLKRFIDIIFSLIILIALSPLLLLIFMLVKYSSKGAVFYLQKRIGLRGEIFNIIKFRSMYIDSEKDEPLLSSKQDTRITAWGKIMRKYRLDELPQFYNVLIGEMSIVGPRPERKFFADQILLEAPHYKLIHKVRPGITSWGMVKFGYAENIKEMISRLKYDIIYIENLSVLNDFKVFILTILIVLQGRGK